MTETLTLSFADPTAIDALVEIIRTCNYLRLGTAPGGGRQTYGVYCTCGALLMTRQGTRPSHGVGGLEVTAAHHEHLAARLLDSVGLDAAGSADGIDELLAAHATVSLAPTSAPTAWAIECDCGEVVALTESDTPPTATTQGLEALYRHRAEIVRPRLIKAAR